MVRAKPQGPGKRRPKTRLIEEQNISELPEEIEMVLLIYFEFVKLSRILTQTMNPST